MTFAATILIRISETIFEIPNHYYQSTIACEEAVTKLGLALVGLGAIGLQAHLPAIRRSERAEVVAIVDPIADRRNDARAQLETPVAEFEFLWQALALDEVQAVVLATPPWITPDLVVEAAHSGRFVLAEKPVATSVAAAGIYDQLSADERSRVQIGLTYRHDPAMEHLRELIASGALGAPLLVRAHIYDERHDPGDGVHDRLISSTLAHGSPVIHEGAHVIDWLRYLLAGEPTVDDAWQVTTRPGLPNPNLTGARLGFPDGSVALLEFGWFTDVLPPCEISFLGDKAHARLDLSDYAVELSTPAGVERVVFPGERTARSFDRQLDRLVYLAEGERTVPEPSLSDGLIALATSEVIATLARSHSQNGIGR